MNQQIRNQIDKWDEVTFVFDVSGSMRSKIFDEALNFIDTLNVQKQILLLLWDTGYRASYWYKIGSTAKKPEYVSGGGTDLMKAIDFLIMHGVVDRKTFIITDGYAHLDEKYVQYENLTFVIVGEEEFKTFQKEAPKFKAIPFQESVSSTDFPHTCPHCGQPAYVGLNSVSCSNQSCVKGFKS